MTQVILQNKAQEALDYMQQYAQKDFGSVVSMLKELQEYGRGRSKLKSIGNDIKRIRVGRRRILCTYNTNIYVWIIAIEKDTKKDYERRKNYVMQYM